MAGYDANAPYGNRASGFGGGAQGGMGRAVPPMQPSVRRAAPAHMQPHGPGAAEPFAQPPSGYAPQPQQGYSSYSAQGYGQPHAPAQNGYGHPPAKTQAYAQGYAQPYGGYPGAAPQGQPSYDPAYGAEASYGDFRPGSAETNAYATDGPDDADGRSGAVNWIGAVCSISLLVGLAVWGVQTIQRDVSGVPVIEALPGPMREKPENPGGAQAQHQGMTLREVQEVGRAGDPAPQVVLAPQTLDLRADPLTVAPLPQPDQTAIRPPAPLDGQAAPALTDAEQAAAYARLVDQLAQGATPLDSTAPVPLGDQNATSSSAATGIVPSGLPGVARSPRPLARPAVFRPGRDAATISPAPTTASTPAVTDIFVDPDTIPSGTRMVQLGAFDSPEIARTEWQRLSTRFARFMEGKRPVVQQALSGGREFHRLRVLGFDDVGEARRFCSVFLAENTPCIPVVAK